VNWLVSDSPAFFPPSLSLSLSVSLSFFYGHATGFYIYIEPVGGKKNAAFFPGWAPGRHECQRRPRVRKLEMRLRASIFHANAPSCLSQGLKKFPFTYEMRIFKRLFHLPRLLLHNNDRVNAIASRDRLIVPIDRHSRGRLQLALRFYCVPFFLFSPLRERPAAPVSAGLDSNSHKRLAQFNFY